MALCEPRHPRLHAVEGLALGEALPLLAAPRLERDQLLGSLPHLVGGQQLAAAEHPGALERVGGALVDDRELGEAVDLVAPQGDAHRAVGGGREHVDDRAAPPDPPSLLPNPPPPVAAPPPRPP